MKRLILIDAHAVIHRAYHALPPLTTPGGEPINAVYGFTTILLRILRELKPDYITAAFDLPGPTFRHTAYERYKAHRPETPSDLAGQFIKTEELLGAFGIPVFKMEGYEADDIIGTIAKILEKDRKVEIIVVTGDMDTLQLVHPRLKVYSMKKGITDTVIYDEPAVVSRYSLKPSQLIDYKGLKGDASDNIPGVKGIGEKTATELIKEFGSIDGVYQALARGTKKISSAIQDKLRAGAEDAKFSKELSIISTKVPIEFALEKTKWSDGSRNAEIKKLFQKFGFFSLIKRLEEKASLAVIKEPVQTSLIQPTTETRTIKSEGELPTLARKLSKTQKGLILFEPDLYLIPGKGMEIFRFSPAILADREAKIFFETNSFAVHDGKAIIHFLRNKGIEVGPISFDLMLAAYLTGTVGRDFSYPAIVTRELGRMVNQDLRTEFVHFFEIQRLLEDKIKTQAQEKVFREIELLVTRILADMEKRGAMLDKKFLQNLAKEINQKLNIFTKEIYHLAGEEFNINSPKQISTVLFGKLGLKTYGLRKTEKGGVISTRESELEKLRALHPIIGKILEYRELAKLKTTYIDALPALTDKEGRLHTTFNQTGTVTGRLSSSDPNLQNIPIQSEYGRKVRNAFVADKGFSLVSFDYSQIELRVAAHLADDKKMMEAFKKGLDIHRMTASEIYNVSLDKVTPAERRAAKTLNFGVLYGMGPSAFSEATGFSKEEARRFIAEYFRDFSGIQGYITRTKAFLEENGYVETLFGRRRYIPEIFSNNWQLKREAERMAVNMPIQGTATGDIVKMAMIGVDKWLKKEKLEEEARMLLQVHDELLFEIKEKEVKRLALKIKEIMEHAAKLKVPLIVDVKVGPNWNDQNKLY